MDENPNIKNKVSFFLPSLRGGGAERVTINLIKNFISRGLEVDLVLANAEGPYLDKLPEKCQILDLKSSKVMFSIFKLVKYIRQENPSYIISGLNHSNIVALFAKMLSRSNVEIVVVVHSMLSVAITSSSLKSKFIPFLMKLTYPYAKKVVTVSKGVAEDLKNTINLSDKKISVIYNPVVDGDIDTISGQHVEHPWFQKKSPPVIITIGRLTKVKDYTTLIRAFAKVRSKKECYLVILGEGEERESLQNLSIELGIESDIWMPGFVENPYKYLKRSTLFVLTSKWEGFGNVLVEAMYCGTQVISTNCPGGPVEILKNGKYGTLVPVGNVEALAVSIYQALNNQLKYNPDLLQKRAMDFSLERVSECYLEVMHESLQIRRPKN